MVATEAQKIPVEEKAINDDEALLDMVEKMTKLNGVKMDQKKTEVDKNDRLPWRRVDKDVCAILVYLEGKPGSVSVSGPEIVSIPVIAETGPDKVGYVLLIVKEGQRGLQSAGAIVRYFRLPS